SALETLAMRMIRGKESVLFADDPTLDAQSYSAYDSSAEERFFDMIAANNFHSALRQVEPIMQAMKKLDPQSVAFALAQISHRLKHIAFTLNAARQEPIDVDQMLATLGGGHMRFLESLPQALCDIVRMLEPSKDEPSLQEIGVVDQALQLIAQRFDDPDLCATYLAQAVGLSAIQLGRLFKRCTGKTIPEAINETRLSKAVRWLRGSDLTTADIALKAGYQNESYFFRVFKEKYGITPRQYEKQYRSATTPSGEA
ncbi:MAG: AraC family transcriptional regulator, partial [Clostridia bacterium]